MNKAEGEMVLDEKGLDEAYDAYDEERDKTGFSFALSDEDKDCIYAAIQAWEVNKSATRAATESDGWMPIESAPKDDTLILVWCDGAEPLLCRFKDGYWRNNHYGMREPYWHCSPKWWQLLSSPPGTHPGKTGDDVQKKPEFVHDNSICTNNEHVVERVARAIRICIDQKMLTNNDSINSVVYERLDKQWNEEAMEYAKAAIQAMGK